MTGTRNRRGRARARCDIRICGEMAGGSLAGQQTIEGALLAPVSRLVHVARRKRAASNSIMPCRRLLATR